MEAIRRKKGITKIRERITDGTGPRGVTRVSLSLPREVHEGLEVLVRSRGYENRSQAVADILREELILHRRSRPEEIMAGTVTLFYDESRPGLTDKVTRIQRDHVKEVVTSLSVLLEGTMRMEVLVVQGPVRNLERIAQDFLNCKGVETGKLTLTAAVLPPLYSRKSTPGGAS